MLVLLLASLGAFLFYRGLDPLYPQELWRYYRPAAAAGAGTVLYRDLDGNLFLAPLSNVARATRLHDRSLPAGQEIVRDALALPGGKTVAYYATERRAGTAERDTVKIVDLQGNVTRSAPVGGTETNGSPIRPALFLSESGKYLAVTDRDRTSAYFWDVSTEDGFRPGQADAPPERMLWTRNADLRSAHVPGQAPYAASPDGKLRAQVRAGKRRAPECFEGKCETGQELVVSAGTPAGAGREAVVLYGAFASFSADGWGPVPTQPAQRLFGRLVWSPSGTQVLFNALDGATTGSYVIGTDGRSQPRLILDGGEALDWLP